MKCPADGATLTMSERSSIEIDYCPECRGVWLDRGELDKILERSLTATPPTSAMETQPVPVLRQGDDGRYQPPAPYRKKRKESWLSELFD